LYVQGDMRERSRRRFESHLLGCEECWKEVQRARAGRELAERARELSPPRLREDVRAAVAMSGPPGPRRARILVPVVTAIVAGLVASALLVYNPFGGHGRQPEPIAAALAAYRSDEVPGTASSPALYRAPDLSAAGLRLLDSGRSSLSGLVVDAFRFTDGRTSVVLLLGSERFPEAVGAQKRTGAAHGWRAAEGGIHLVCADSPVSYILMSLDGSLLDRAEPVLRHQAISLTS
jgi:anti-sigma factor RsiW